MWWSTSPLTPSLFRLMPHTTRMKPLVFSQKCTGTWNYVLIIWERADLQSWWSQISQRVGTQTGWRRWRGDHKIIITGVEGFFQLLGHLCMYCCQSVYVNVQMFFFYLFVCLSIWGLQTERSSVELSSTDICSSSSSEQFHLSVLAPNHPTASQRYLPSV